MTETNTPGNNAAAQLKAIVERVERLKTEIAERNADVSDVYKEAKGNGFHVAAIKEVIRLRAQDPDKRREHESLVDNYRHALGMLD